MSDDARVLLALDAVSRAPGAIGTALELAVRLDAELVALFVEDLDLVRSAELSVVRSVSLLTAADEAFDLRSLERELRRRSEEARRVLDAEARRRGVRWSFRVVRGSVDLEIGAAACAGDLLVQGCTALPLPARGPAAATPGRPRYVVLHGPAARAGGPVLVVVDGGEAYDDVLVLAARLASGSAGGLELLVVGDDAAERGARERRLTEVLTARSVAFRCRTAPVPGVRDLPALARRAGAGLLVLSACWTRELGVDATALAARLGCPLLLSGPPGPTR